MALLLPLQLLRPVLVLVALVFVAGAAHAQSASNTALGNTDANPDPVFVFNRICYAQVPDVRAIRSMSLELAWRSMAKEELAQFKTVDEPKVLDGWDVQVGERLFKVAVQQSGLTASQKKAFPDFGAGTATTCSIVLDDQQLASVFMPNMQTLAGKEPVSKDVPEGLLQVTTWAGGNDAIKVFLVAKAPATGKGGLLNVTVLQK
ncbi:MAG: hypothetical protein AAGM04_05835 [Pseudomonadota bacterium]